MSTHVDLKKRVTSKTKAVTNTESRASLRKGHADTDLSAPEEQSSGEIVAGMLANLPKGISKTAIMATVSAEMQKKEKREEEEKETAHNDTVKRFWFVKGMFEGSRKDGIVGMAVPAIHALMLQDREMKNDPTPIKTLYTWVKQALPPNKTGRRPLADVKSFANSALQASLEVKTRQLNT